MLAKQRPPTSVKGGGGGAKHPWCPPRVHKRLQALTALQGGKCPIHPHTTPVLGTCLRLAIRKLLALPACEQGPCVGSGEHRLRQRGGATPEHDLRGRQRKQTCTIDCWHTAFSRSKCNGIAAPFESCHRTPAVVNGPSSASWAGSLPSSHLVRCSDLLNKEGEAGGAAQLRRQPSCLPCSPQIRLLQICCHPQYHSCCC